MARPKAVDSWMRTATTEAQRAVRDYVLGLERNDRSAIVTECADWLEAQEVFYPPDVFPPISGAEDAKTAGPDRVSAQMARHICRAWPSAMRKELDP